MTGILDPGFLAVAAGAFLLAGMVKGTVGIGLPTAAIAVMSQATEPRTAIAMVLVPSIFANLWQIWRMGEAIGALRRYRIYVACLAVSIFLTGSFVTGSVPEAALLAIVGLTVTAYAASALLWHPPVIAERHDRAAQAGLGLLSGLVGGLTTIWAPMMVAYLIGRRVAPDEFVRATGVMILTGHAVLGTGFALSGLVSAEIALGSALMIPLAILGFQVGERLRARLDAKRFRRVVLFFFLAMGVNLVRRALS